MGWVFDKELGVKRVPDGEASPLQPEPVMFNGVDCSLLAARYVAHRKAVEVSSGTSDDGEKTV